MATQADAYNAKLIYYFVIYDLLFYSEMKRDELKERLKTFAVKIVKLVDKLPNTAAGRAIGNQIVRSGTSPGANYRAACLGKSEKDFLNKLKMVEEELDKTMYWLELIMDLRFIKPELLKDLYSENDELLRIIIKSVITMRSRMNGISEDSSDK